MFMINIINDFVRGRKFRIPPGPITSSRNTVFPSLRYAPNQAVLDTLHVTFFDQSYVSSVEAMADNFVVGF